MGADGSSPGGEGRLVVEGLTVNEWVGIAAGLGATLITLLLTLWFLARRR